MIFVGNIDGGSLGNVDIDKINSSLLKSHRSAFVFVFF